MTQLSVWQFLRHRCCTSSLSLCLALRPHHWAPLCENADHSGRTLQGFKESKSCHVFSILLCLAGSFRLCSSTPVFDLLSASTFLSHRIGPPLDTLMCRSLRCACLQVGCHLLNYRYSACNFKGRD